MNLVPSSNASAPERRYHRWLRSVAVVRRPYKIAARAVPVIYLLIAAALPAGMRVLQMPLPGVPLVARISLSIVLMVRESRRLAPPGWPTAGRPSR